MPLSATTGDGLEFSHSVTWNRRGAIRDLGTLPGGTTSISYDLNRHGVVVGTSELGNGEWHGVRWDRHGRITDLGRLPGGLVSMALAINDTGRIVGDADTGTARHAVLWR